MERLVIIGSKVDPKLDLAKNTIIALAVGFEKGYIYHIINSFSSKRIVLWFIITIHNLEKKTHLSIVLVFLLFAKAYGDQRHNDNFIHIVSNCS